LQQYGQSHGAEPLPEDIKNAFLRYPCSENSPKLKQKGKQLQNAFRVPILHPHWRVQYMVSRGGWLFISAWVFGDTSEQINQTSLHAIFFIGNHNINPCLVSGD